MEKQLRKSVSDLGIAAYLLMHGYKAVGRKGKTVYFDIKKEEENEFDRLSFDYVTGPYHQFDACLMILKKMPEYLREE
jgi:hypothetical protein